MPGSHDGNISVIGLGYVGLITAAGFGLKGHRVLGIDTAPDKVKAVTSRAPPLFEEGLEEALQAIDIQATTDYDAVLESDVTFVCVNTPSRADGSMNGDYLQDATERLAATLGGKKDHLVVLRSTVTPGTTESMVAPVLKDVGICFNPEFLREGKALHDFLNPSRIIIGEKQKADGDKLQDLYRHFNRPVIRTDMRTAEMIKYASNAFLATKISFINEIGNICKQIGVDVRKVAHGMGYDDRIGAKFLNAGAGFGGSCFPKDVRGLITMAQSVGYEPAILRDVLNINEGQPLRLIQLLEKHMTVKGRTIGILGLAFKPGTDDIREARAIKIVEALLAKGARIKAYDPQAMPAFRTLFPLIDYVPAEQVLDSDAVLIVTEWPEFERLDYRGRVVVDGRNIAKAREARVYEGICW